MEEWHSNHPEKGIRFTTAMQKVIFSKSLSTIHLLDDLIPLRSLGPWEQTPGSVVQKTYSRQRTKWYKRRGRIYMVGRDISPKPLTRRVPLPQVLRREAFPSYGRVQPNSGS